MTIHRSTVVEAEESMGAVLTCKHDDSVSLIVRASKTDEVIVRFVPGHISKLLEMVMKLEQVAAESIKEADDAIAQQMQEAEAAALKAVEKALVN